MSLRSSVSFNDSSDPYTAGANAAQGALDTLGAQPNAAIVFASSFYDQKQVIDGVRSVTKDALLVGASTAGEITTVGPLKKHSVAVMLITSDSIRFSAAADTTVGTDARAAGKTVADKVKQLAGDDFRALLMFPDVLVGNGADIVRGILDSLGDHFPVMGGAAGDDFKFSKTFQYLNDQVLSGAVVGLGLSGTFRLGVGVKHGWIPIGSPSRVTKSQGSILHELDGKPAIKLYEDYFGEEEARHLKEETLAKLAIAYPLGMRIAGSEEMLLRDPLSVDAHGSITCAAEIPEGAEVQLMIGSRESAVAVAREAAQYALNQLEGAQPKAVIIFNCIARNKLFGERAGDEIAAIQEVLGPSVPLLGFYTYGEQAPLGGEVRNLERCNPAFHNETVVICVLGDAQ
ncbi:hypothetical protein FJY94_03985 [Candidatus Kaiserbacteria bacterium]|nr:hypothetical protein [Candidatus Kaiserbacteria bacterium]